VEVAHGPSLAGSRHQIHLQTTSRLRLALSGERTRGGQGDSEPEALGELACCCSVAQSVCAPQLGTTFVVRVEGDDTQHMERASMMSAMALAGTMTALSIQGLAQVSRAAPMMALNSSTLMYCGT